MKRIISMLLAVMSVAALTACGQQKDTAVDAQGLAKALVEKVSFESELTAVSDEELGYYFQLPEGCTAAAYMSSGSPAGIRHPVQERRRRRGAAGVHAGVPGQPENRDGAVSAR